MLPQSTVALAVSRNYSKTNKECSTAGALNQKERPMLDAALEREPTFCQKST